MHTNTCYLHGWYRLIPEQPQYFCSRAMLGPNKPPGWMSCLISFVYDSARVLNDDIAYRWPSGLRRPVRKRGVAGSIPGREKFSFRIFRSFLVLDISAKPIQMKSSMTFIQSNRCIEIDRIVLKMAVVYMAAV